MPGVVAAAVTAVLYVPGTLTNLSGLVGVNVTAEPLSSVAGLSTLPSGAS